MPTNLDHSFLSNNQPFTANLSQKNNVLIPDSTSWTNRSKPHVTRDKPNINRLDTLIEISQRRMRRNCKEPGGRLIDFSCWLQRLIKLKSWLCVRGVHAHRAYKAWVEAGLWAGGADNELHRLCGIYSPEGGSCYRALLFAIKKWLWQTYGFQELASTEIPVWYIKLRNHVWPYMKPMPTVSGN